MRLYNSITPSSRHLCLVDYHIFSKEKINFFLSKLKSNSGRNHHGHISVRHRGGGTAGLYLVLDQFERRFNIPYRIETINYDSYRSAFISLLRYQNGIYCYRLAIHKTFIGDTLMSYDNVPENIKNGDGCLIKFISPGSLICNIELKPQSGFQLSRSAGCYSVLLKRDERSAYLKLGSQVVKLVSIFCMAFIGSVSNKNFRYTDLGKAGNSRNLGIRPTVRGVAMNPVDHPHGGGEGKKSKRSFPRSPWGKRYKKFKKIKFIK